MLTYREWVIVQKALDQYRSSVEDDRDELNWDDAEDGERPTVAEVDALAVKVGDMPHGRK